MTIHKKSVSVCSCCKMAFMCKMDIFLFISHHVLCNALKRGEGYFIRSVQPVDEDGDGGGGELK